MSFYNEFFLHASLEEALQINEYMQIYEYMLHWKFKIFNVSVCVLSLGRLHAVQKGIKIDSKGKESKPFLLQLMDQLEKVWLLLWLLLEV